MDIIDMFYNDLEEDLIGHSSRVAKYTLLLYKLSNPMHKSPLSDDRVQQAVIYHDMGKMFVPDKVLDKQSRLEKIDWKIVYEHPGKGANMLTEFASISVELPDDKLTYELAAIVAAQHHERWDGSGYPKKLKQLEIHPIARMCSIADAFDAITTNRPYHKAVSLDHAFSEIEKHGGSQFDPDFAKLFMENRDAVESVFFTCHRMLKFVPNFSYKPED